jgi:hypothetical protein
VYVELGLLCLVRFVSEQHPEVLLEGNAGGANPDFIPTLYDYASAAIGYQVAEEFTTPGAGRDLRWNASAGFTPEMQGASVVLRSDDGTFFGLVGCYACGGPPTRLFTFRDGHLVDVTLHYASMIGAEAKSAWREAQKALGSASERLVVEGPVAQWAADQCELGDATLMW